MLIRSLTVALAALTATAAAACGAAAYGSQSHNRSASGRAAAGAGTARAATVHVARTASGRLLVDSAGFTLYMFTADHRGRDHCVKVSGCASVWPPLLSSHPTAGAGAARRLLGTVAIGGGRRQVTYAGHPLYTYAGDSGRGQTSYVGAVQFGGAWYAVSPSGRAVH